MSFYTDVIQKDPRYHSTECIRDLDLLEPWMRAAVVKFENIAKSMGHQLVATETFRSSARQEQLALTTKQASDQINSLQKQLVELQTKLNAAPSKDEAASKDAAKNPTKK